MFFNCEKPVYDDCNTAAAVLQMIVPGSGLLCCCCYGTYKPDCCGVCCAGITQMLMCPLWIGMISSQCVAYKMMGWCQPEERGSSAQQKV